MCIAVVDGDDRRPRTAGAQLDDRRTTVLGSNDVSADATGINQAVPDRRKRLIILGICSMSLFIVGLDATIVNIALPAIHRSFHSPLSGLQWTIDAYTLALPTLLVPAGWGA